jgi:hypothetical protein
MLMSVDLRKRCLADQLITALREVVEENGCEVVEKDDDNPEEVGVVIQPPVGKERMLEFAKEAAARCGVEWDPRVTKTGEE